MVTSNQETLFAHEPDSGSEQKPDSDDVWDKKNVKGPLH
jgi:hypothetical protein